jgi:gamma-glutamyltranspeptidase/glutathione hydrolase
MLNMMEPHDVGGMGWGSTGAVHLMIEAQRRAYADRAVHMGDPDYADIPVALLTSKEYASRRFENFNSQRAGDSSLIAAGQLPDESPNTTHYSVMDEAGNAVSVTTTLNSSYGNKIVVEGAGFLLNNEMDDFATRVTSSHVNQIMPGKRMMSSMSPTIVARDGKSVLITGSPGGSAIINTVLQVIVNVIDHDMDLETAVSSPRLTHQWQPDNIRYETGAIGDAVADELVAMGHKGLNGSGFYIGEANSILAGDGFIDGMSDPRIVGGVAGY